MKKAIIIFLAIVLVLGGTLALMLQKAPGLVVDSPGPALGAPNAALTARGRVVPQHSAMLSFPSKGIVPEGFVSEVLVQPGSVVKEGALLAQLDTRDLTMRIEEARTALAHAQATYEQLMAGATPEEIAVAKAQLAQAQAHVQQTRGAVTKQDIVASQARLNQARANLTVIQAGTKETRLRAAQATLNQTNAKLQTQRDQLSADKTTAQLHMEQAANELRNRQDAYSRIVWDNQARGDALEQADKDREAEALRAVQDAEKAVQAAMVAYEQARQAEISGIATSESDVDGAQAFLNELQAGADADVIAAAHAQVAQAAADLAKLQGEQRAGMLAAANAEEASSQAMLAKITATPRSVDVALAATQVQEAEAALKHAETMLELASLRAPIAGTIVKVNIKVGEVPSISEPSIILADLSNWQVETDDMTELGVVQLREGDTAKITFEAIPDLTLTGKITRIELLGRSSEANRNIVYTVVVTPDRQDLRLLWNMSASVEIQPRV